MKSKVYVESNLFRHKMVLSLSSESIRLELTDLNNRSCQIRWLTSDCLRRISRVQSCQIFQRCRRRLEAPNAVSTMCAFSGLNNWALAVIGILLDLKFWLDELKEYINNSEHSLNCWVCWICPIKIVPVVES